MYTYRRPRTYFDRRWLEGYIQTSQRIHRKPFSHMHADQAEFLLHIATHAREPLTAFQKGRVDAVLDAFGF